MFSRYAQALQKYISLPAYFWGTKDEAIDVVSKAAAICKEWLQIDTARKRTIQSLLLQRKFYASDALYKYSMDKTFEACLRFGKLQSNTSCKKDDYGL